MNETVTQDMRHVSDLLTNQINEMKEMFESKFQMLK